MDGPRPRLEVSPSNSGQLPKGFSSSAQRSDWGLMERELLLK